MKNKVKPGNYIVIQSFMVTDLNLKGNELLIYAIIHGFTQDGVNYFEGSLQYIADWTNSTRQGVSKALKSLVEKGLIEKKETYINGVKFCAYRTTKFNGGVQQSLTGVQQSLTGGVQQSLTNKDNIDNIQDKDNNIINNSVATAPHDTDTGKITQIDSTKKQNDKPVRHKYGEYKNVLLSDAEMEKLKAEFPDDYKDRIERVSEYVASTGKSYKNYLATIRNWAKRDKGTAKPRPGKQTYNIPGLIEL